MYAVIDLGSNSFHLLIARYTGCHFAIVNRCSKKIQLADGLSRHGKLTRAAMERGLDCLSHFKQTLSQHPIRRLRVVATQALRQAANAREFVEKAKTMGFDIDVISGTREAELIFRGVCGPLPNGKNNRLVIDIGGASTEIAIGQGYSSSLSHGYQILLTHSLPMGCVSWNNRFFADGVEYGRRSVDAKNAAREILAPILDDLNRIGWSEIYASSGSAKMLSAIAQANSWTDGTITLPCITHIEQAIHQVKHHAEITLPGLKPERQDLLASGVSIMATIMELLGINSVTYSNTALREGLLAEMSNRRVDYFLEEGSEDVEIGVLNPFEVEPRAFQKRMNTSL